MRRWLFIATVIVIPLMLMVIIAIVIVRNRDEISRTEELLAQWQEAGGALTLAELKPEPIPDEQNAAVLYEQAFAIVTTQGDNNIDVYLDDGKMQKVDAVLGRVEKAINIAIEAGNRPSCQWNSPLYEEGFDALVPFLGDCRSLARVLGVAARRSAQQGDLERSMQILLAMRQLGVHAAEEPMIIGLLVHLSIQFLAIQTFQDTFADRSLPHDSINEFIQNKICESMIRSAMYTEGTMGIDWVRHKYDPSDGVVRRSEELEFFVATQIHILDELQKPEYERDWTFIDQRNIDARFQSGVAFLPLLSSFQNLSRGRRLELAAQTAVALRRHRAEHGGYPETWDMPIDPLSGQLMIYRRTDTGFEITGSLKDDDNPLSWQWE